MKNLALTAVICGASILGINATTYAAVISSTAPVTKIESSIETQELGINWGRVAIGAVAAGTLIAINDSGKTRAHEYHEDRHHQEHHSRHGFRDGGRHQPPPPPPPRPRRDW